MSVHTNEYPDFLGVSWNKSKRTLDVSELELGAQNLMRDIGGRNFRVRLFKIVEISVNPKSVKGISLRVFEASKIRNHTFELTFDSLEQMWSQISGCESEHRAQNLTTPLDP